ncbi:hypothetical protein Ancab_017429 [Ancistrocladus abbreviatus]
MAGQNVAILLILTMLATATFAKTTATAHSPAKSLELAPAKSPEHAQAPTKGHPMPPPTKVASPSPVISIPPVAAPAPAPGRSSNAAVSTSSVFAAGSAAVGFIAFALSL